MILYYVSSGVMKVSILVNIFTVAVGLVLILYVIKSMVNKKMTESGSILWLLIGLAGIILGLFPSIITFIADILGIWYPPTIIFLISYIGLLFIVLKHTIDLSIQSNRMVELYMQVALLNAENEKLKEELNLKNKGADSH